MIDILSKLTDAQFWTLLFVLGIIIAYIFSSIITKLTGWR